MTRTAVVLAAAMACLATGLPAAAAPSPLRPNCFAAAPGDDGAFIERACAKPRYDAAQAEVKALYDKLYAGYDKGERRRLATAQKSWLKFRDDECELESRDSAGGSLYGTLLSACYLGMTKDRIAHLKALATCDSGPCVP